MHIGAHKRRRIYARCRLEKKLGRWNELREKLKGNEKIDKREKRKEKTKRGAIVNELEEMVTR